MFTFVLSGGVDKMSVVIGPFFIVGSFLSILRQTGRLETDVEIPILVILIGALLLAARLPQVPLPRWFDLRDKTS